MKKKILPHFVSYALVELLLFSAFCPLHAQVSNPSSWDRFVAGNDNALVSDTFRLQTFGRSEWDNWTFSLDGSSSVVSDKYTMKIPVGSGFSFQSFPLSLYREVNIAIHLAGLHLAPKENLLFDIYRGGQLETVTVHSPTSAKDYLSYGTYRIKRAPSYFALRTLQIAASKGGYYMTDSVYAYGNIPSYSLFSGRGDWNDTTLWSHLPPLRHRSALIKGEVAITEESHCKEIAIHSGSLNIHPDSRLVLQDLDLYGNEAFLYSEGTMLLSGRISLHKTFEEAGKWYFISFPFDVYPSGIDPRFEQKDDTPNDGGNYFYVQSYNGDKRASANQAAGNWEVVPICPENTPLFEKGHGYLIALDEEATDLTLSFSSRPGDIPEDFAHAGVIVLSLASPTASDDNQENYGWYLCGNPFPAPLVLSQIEGNAALDGFLYVYDGNGYRSYSLNSDHALPPFAAFFVKASSPTELRISAHQAPTQTVLTIPTNHPVGINALEPCLSGQSTGIEDWRADDLRFYIKGRHLYLQNIPEAGSVRIVNMWGHCLLQKEVQRGSQAIPLPHIPGTYILQIHSAHYQRCYKVVFP